MSCTPAVYSNFRAWVPRKRLTVGPQSTHDWLYYDWGSRNYPEPLICLHDLLGSADAFYHQVVSLAPRGYRVLSLALPLCTNITQFCTTFQSFLDTLHITKCHLYGAGLGGFLALAAAAQLGDRIKSVILTHAWITSDSVKRRIKHGPGIIKLMPDFMVRGTIKSICPRGKAERTIVEAIEFVVKRTLFDEDKEALISRLLLYTTSANALGDNTHALPDQNITILDTLDRKDPLAPQLAKELSSQFPRARLALLKSGGDFPYLSRPGEVNMHLVVHMRRHAPPPLETMPLPPPVFIAPPPPARNAKENGRTSGETQDTDPAAKAVARKQEEERLSRYERQISVIKTSSPERSDTFLAAVLDDNNGDVGISIQRIQDNTYSQNYDVVLFERAVQAARDEANHASRGGNDIDVKKQRGVSNEEIGTNSAQAQVSVENVSHTRARSVPVGSNLPDGRGTISSSTRRQGAKSGTFEKYANDEHDQVTAYLTSGKTSPRKISLVSRGPVPFSASPSRKSSRSSADQSPSSSLPAMPVKSGVPEARENAQRKMKPQDGSALIDGDARDKSTQNIGGTKNRERGKSVDASDEWNQFREREHDPLSTQAGGNSTLKDADDDLDNADDERLLEWSTVADSAINRK